MAKIEPSLNVISERRRLRPNCLQAGVGKCEGFPIITIMIIDP